MDKQKKRISKWNLYQKEQLLIIIILLCFVLSRMWLPKIKSRFTTSPIVNVETPKEPTLENNSTIDTNTKNDYTENIISKNEGKIEESTDASSDNGYENPSQNPQPEQPSSNEKPKTDNTPQKPNVESGNQSEEINSQVNDQEQTPQIQKPEPQTQKPQTQKPQTQKPQAQKPQAQEPQAQEPQTQKPQTQKPQTQKPETQKPQTQEPETQKPDSEETVPPTTEEKKEWVPPVYETIHHDAVYETKRVAICNYCSEVFDSVGDFQVHKNENGG